MLEMLVVCFQCWTVRGCHTTSYCVTSKEVDDRVVPPELVENIIAGPDAFGRLICERIWA